MKKYQSRIILFLAAFFAFTGISFSAHARADESSSVITTTTYSPNLGMDWNYDVYLPKGYQAQANRKYPVLYMLHGVYGDHTNMLEKFDSRKMLDDVIQKSGKPMIVVFVDGFNSFYVDQKGGQQMETAIVRDLIPTIEHRYKVSRRVSQHAIGGISMGGYGAARLALKYPQLFSQAAMMSPSVWYNLSKDSPLRQNLHAFTDGRTNWSDRVYASLFPTRYMNFRSRNVKLYVESTSSDDTVPIRDVQRFVRTAKHRGIATKFVQDSGDNHNWTYWGKIAPQTYQWVNDQMDQETWH
jgi:S-formylglutathione hydrolase FrmB